MKKFHSHHNSSSFPNVHIKNQRELFLHQYYQSREQKSRDSSEKQSKTNNNSRIYGKPLNPLEISSPDISSIQNKSKLVFS